MKGHQRDVPVGLFLALAALTAAFAAWHLLR